MIKAERQDKVRQLLEEQGTVSVKEISDALGVSDMTIRRDLEELASLGEIERVHGGARSAQGRPHAMLRHEYSHSEKRTKHAEEKLQIARRSVELIEEGSTIFLGTGTTVEQMASMLPAFRLRIVTNSLSVFNLLEAREDCDLCLVGGMYRRRTAAFVGPTAEDTLRALGIDAAFIGANGILDGDVSTSNMEEGRIQQLAFSKADSRYLIADSSKIGKRDFYLLPPGQFGRRGVRAGHRRRGSCRHRGTHAGYLLVIATGLPTGDAGGLLPPVIVETSASALRDMTRK